MVSVSSVEPAIAAVPFLHPAASIDGMSRSATRIAAHSCSCRSWLNTDATTWSATQTADPRVTRRASPRTDAASFPAKSFAVSAWGASRCRCQMNASSKAQSD